MRTIVWLTLLSQGCLLSWDGSFQPADSDPPVGDSPDSDTEVDTEDTESAVETDDTELAVDTEDTDDTEVAVDTEDTDDTDPAVDTDDTDPAVDTDDTDPAVDTDDTDDTDPVVDTDDTAPIVDTDDTDIPVDTDDSAVPDTDTDTSPPVGNRPPVLEWTALGVGGRRSLTTTPNQPTALDASASSDPDNDPLTFMWSSGPRPMMSSYMFVNPGNVDTLTFIPDREGTYTFFLDISDGSLTDRGGLWVHASNGGLPPTVVMPADPMPAPGTPTTLTAGCTDPDSSMLRYAWRLFSAPPGSSVVVTPGMPAVSPSITFTPDVAGVYTFSCICTDLTFTSVEQFIDVTAQ